MKTLLTWLFAALVMVLLVVHETGMLEERYGPGAPPGERLLAAEPQADVTLVDLRAVELPRPTWSLGRVEARREVRVFPELSAVVVESDLELGRRVEVGDVLVRLDDAAVALGVQAARRGLELAGSRVAAAEAGVAGAAASVDGAQVDLDHARTEHARQRDLFEKQATTDQALQAAETAERGAEVALVAARAGLAAAEAQVAVAVASLEPARTAVADAERLAAKAVVRAPVAGVVTQRGIETGSLASPAAPLAVLRPADDLWARAWFQQPPTLGDELLVRLDGVPAGRLPVAELDTSADPFTRSRGVRVHLAGLPDFAELAPRLAPGTAIELGLPGPAHGELLVPAAAVRVQGQVQTVRVQRVDRIVTRHLRSVPLTEAQAALLGLEAGAWRVVRTGLVAGDRVVLEQPR